MQLVHRTDRLHSQRLFILHEVLVLCLQLHAPHSMHNLHGVYGMHEVDERLHWVHSVQRLHGMQRLLAVHRLHGVQLLHEVHLQRLSHHARQQRGGCTPAGIHQRTGHAARQDAPSGRRVGGCSRKIHDGIEFDG